MFQNFFYKLVLAVFFFSSCFYTFRLGSDLFHYFLLSSSAEVEEISFSLVPLEDHEFTLEAHFNFPYRGKSLKGSTLFFSEKTKNIYRLEEKDQEFFKRKWIVWFQKNHPKSATLEKIFPIKPLLYTSFLWLLTLYFYGLGLYVQNLRQKS